MKRFTDFFHKPAAQHDESLRDVPDQHLIDKFHEAHRHLEELGHHLHKRGYHMEIEYKDHMAARHGREGQGSTLFFNQALHSPKDVSVSKSALAVDRTGKKRK
jgi:hypothetical protein